MSDGIDCEIYLSVTEHCSNGHNIHNWIRKIIKTVKHPNEEKRYRVCSHCKEARPMYINGETFILDNDKQDCLFKEPLDDLNDLYVINRPPTDLWRKLLSRVLMKLNPIVIEDDKIIHCRTGIDTCSCHSRYMRDCPFANRVVEKDGTMSWYNTKHIKPLEEPWCDIPIPIGPNRTMLTSKEFNAKWKRIHGKALEYLKHYSVDKTFPEGALGRKIPHYLMDTTTTILGGEFIQLSLD